MVRQRWIAYVIAAMWLGQLELLWPLPSSAAAQVLANLGGQMPDAVAELETSLWISWVTRIVLICIGLASAAMFAKRNRHWATLSIVAACAYLISFQPWHMLPVLATSWSWSHMQWLLGHPGWLFSIAIFPSFLAMTSGYAFIFILRGGDKHAI